ncbi:MAG: hypothetical protein JW731_10935 [Bacteroidales bacterium]|nr:hypothetical protein [Bacteroidales bacterium]
MKCKVNTVGFLIILIAVVLQSNFQLFSQDRKGDFPGRTPEKVNLLMDRELYISGENIWFTASCFLKVEKIPSPLSSILYVELLNSGNKTFVSEKFKLAEGTVTGSLQIPEELPTNHYFIRAYTMYMRNFAPEAYFTGSITVMNPDFPANNKKPADTIGIFTQSGFLVPNVLNSIALQFPHQMVREVEDIILSDTSGNQLRYFDLWDNGIAYSKLTLSDTTRYHIEVYLKNHDTIVLQLPPFKSDVLVAKTEITGEFLSYQLLGKVFKSEGRARLTIRTQDHAWVYDHEFEISELADGIKVSLEKPGPGINYLELRNEDGSLLCLDAVYVGPNNLINVPITTSAEEYHTRQKAELKIQTDIIANEPIELLQISVTAKGTNPGHGKTLNELLVANPELIRDLSVQQFDPEQVEAALLILKSHLKDHLSEKINSSQPEFEFIPDIRDISITGLVTDKNTGAPVEGMRVFTSVLHDGFQFHSAVTSGDGRFVISFPHLEGKQEMFLCTGKSGPGQYEIKLNNDFSTQFTGLEQVNLEFDTIDRKLMEELLVNQQVSVYFSGLSEPEIQPVKQLPPWLGNDINTVVLSDYIPLNSIKEVFNEIVPWARLKEKDGNVVFQVFDDQSQIAYEDPIVMLDGIVVTDNNILLDLHPAQIDRIEVINQTYVIGNLNIRGLISIRTKTDNFGGVNFPDDVIFLNYQMQTMPATYHPADTVTRLLRNQNYPWFRTLLYYESIDTIPAGGKQISFYTSDYLAEYEVILKGKTKNGKMIYGFTTFNVSKK